MRIRHQVVVNIACMTLLLCTAAALLGQKSYDGGGLIVWRDPGDVAALDLTYGSDGKTSAPQPPFAFEKEIKSGVNPKIKVKDAASRSWAVKWGDEAHAEVLASRLAWASGYYVIPSHFIRSGKVSGIRHLSRGGKNIDKDGGFNGAGFQLWDEGLLKTSWSWNDNPFRTASPGNREMNGLKIIMMLTSNWDNKDDRDLVRGSNNGVHEEKTPEGTAYHFFVFDWGSSMGRWGGYGNHTKWDCKGYAGQTPGFVASVRDGKVEWGYAAAQYTGDINNGISVEDVAWLMKYLGKLTDEQLRTAATAAGATADEVSCFTSSIRERIEQMRKITSSEVTGIGR